MAFRPRWFEHEESEELCTIDILDEERQRSGDRDGLPAALVRHQTPTCYAQVRVLTLVGRVVAVDDSCEQTVVLVIEFRGARCTQAVAL